MTEHDDYPDLPPLPVPVQLACRNIEPEHLTMPPEDLQVVVDVSQSIRRFVDHCTPNLDAETVGMTAYNCLLAVMRVIQEALNNRGDVTSDD